MKLAIVEKKTFLAGLQCTLTSSCAKTITFSNIKILKNKNLAVSNSFHLRYAIICRNICPAGYRNGLDVRCTPTDEHDSYYSLFSAHNLLCTGRKIMIYVAFFQFCQISTFYSILNLILCFTKQEA